MDLEFLGSTGGLVSLSGGCYAQMGQFPPVVLPISHPIVCPSHYGRYGIAKPCL